MRFFTTIQTCLLAMALAVSSQAVAENATNAAPLVSARDFYNAGTSLLAARKFDEAERMFQAAMAAQDDRIQPRALYNVGHTRFDSGMDRLKKGPDAQKTAAKGDSAIAAADHAIQQSEAALADNNLMKMIEAYMEGRGARHELKDAEKAVSEAMETYRKTLEQWQRAADDFKGAHELNPADTNAAHNAELVEQHIAKLVDTMRKMQQMMGMMGKKKQDLGKMLAKLKGQIPAPNAPPGETGDDDDDNQGIKPGSLTGQKEGPGRQSEELRPQLSPDQASQILSGLSLDGTRRLNMSDKEGLPPKDRKGRNW